MPAPRPAISGLGISALTALLAAPPAHADDAPKPVVIGNLDVSLVDAVIGRDRQQIEYCHQRALKSQPDLGGDVVVKFFIDKAGAVTQASVKTSTVAHEGLESCVLARIQRLQFPAPPGGGLVIVTYPFRFGAPPPPDPAKVAAREAKAAAKEALTADTGITQTFDVDSVRDALTATALCRVATAQVGRATCDLDVAGRLQSHWCRENRAPAVDAAGKEVVDGLVEDLCRYQGGFDLGGQPIAFGPAECTAEILSWCGG